MSGSGGLGSDIQTTGNNTYSAFGDLRVAENYPTVLMHFPYNVNADIASDDSTASGSLSVSNELLQVSSGAATSSKGQITSLKALEYHPGLGALARMTAIYGTGTAGNEQIVGIGDDNDGFFFGYNGTDFGIMRRSGGSDTWVAQADWNEDTFDGNGPSGVTLDTTKGNVFQIQFQWLGFGQINFGIENPNTGAVTLVHTIRYTNQNTALSIKNPTLPMLAASENTTNNTDIVMQVGCLASYIEGQPNANSYTRNAISNTKAVTTEANVLTIRNKSTFASVTNKIRIQPDFLEIASDGNQNVTLNVYLNTTLGGSPSYTDIGTNTSVVDYDVAGTTVTGGTLVAAFALAKVDSNTVLFKDYNFVLNPGDTLTFAALSGASNSVTVGLSWVERFT